MESWNVFENIWQLPWNLIEQVVGEQNKGMNTDWQNIGNYVLTDPLWQYTEC